MKSQPTCDHLSLAKTSAQEQRPFLAYAAIKTARSTGQAPPEAVELEQAYRSALPELARLNHNQYYRCKTVADYLLAAEPTTSVRSVLDVGGGEGQLASFLPEAWGYCLAEPSFNGISGENLPFDLQAFDYVIASHVVEHIAKTQRAAFLDRLLACASESLIILNPVSAPGHLDRERLELIHSITQAKWAAEHLECELPTVEELLGYAESRGLSARVTPNGSLTATMAYVFVDYFARKAELREPWQQLNAFVNSNYCDLFMSKEHPNAYLFEFRRS